MKGNQRFAYTLLWAIFRPRLIRNRTLGKHDVAKTKVKTSFVLEIMVARATRAIPTFVG